MSLLNHILRCNSMDLTRYLPLWVGGEQAGWVRRDRLDMLARFPGTFMIEDAFIALRPAGDADTPQTRTAGLRSVVATLAAEGLIPRLRGEDYAVRASWSSPELCRVDRAAVLLFGFKAYGVHLNGYRRGADGGLWLWIGRRALDKAVEPGKLDNIVAGGQPAGLSLWDNLIKEAAEEAAMPAALAATARPAGVITYCLENAEGLKPDTLFIYDIDLPADFVPMPHDGEMTGYTLMSLPDILEQLRDSTDFKFNVALVLIDFALRHGALTPDDEPAYEALVAGLHFPHPRLTGNLRLGKE